MITVIATVLNEADSVHHLMNGLLQQTRQADEIVVVDGGSQDNTVEILRGYESRLPLKIIVRRGSNISQGRNAAITAAQGDILAITDAGVRLAPTWLDSITRPLLDNANVSVVSGFYKAHPFTPFEVAMGVTVLPVVSEITEASFLPSSRSLAVRKATAQAVGGYPEWLDYCEDLIFDLRLKLRLATFVFVPSALVYFRPRSTLKAYYLQYYRYARGDGKADLWRARHAIRYLTYLVALPTVVLLAFAVHPVFIIFLPLGGCGYLYRPYRRLREVMRDAPTKSAWTWLQVIWLIPLLRAVGDVAKMLGYPVGWKWRLQHRPTDWRRI